MRLTPLQQSFSAGELSPLLYARSDLKAYNSGLTKMENMLPDSRGPAVSRPGLSFVEKYAGNDGRLMTFQVSDALFFLGVFLDQKMAIASPVGGIPAQNQVTNSRFLDGSTGWTVDTQGSQSYVTFAPLATRVYGSRNTNHYARIQQSITVTNQTEQHTVRIGTGAEDFYRLKIGTTVGGNDLVDLLSNQQIASVDFVPNNATYHITFEHNGQDDVTNTPVTVATIAGYETSTGFVEFVTPWPEAALKEVHLIQAPSGDTYYFTHPNYPVQKLLFDETTFTFTFTPVTFTGAPTEWTDTNHPATGTYYQGRLWLGGTPDQPETFWASKSGEPEDFTVGTTDADGFVSTIAKYGRIKWMSGTKNLLIGTENGEHIVTAQQKILTPSDRSIDQQSAYGSCSIQALQVGDQVFYVSPDRTKVRAMQYEWGADNWLSKDLTFTSEHITKPGIRFIEWQQNPNNLFWGIRTDGSLCSMTYERGENIYGWADHTNKATPPEPNMRGALDGTVAQYYGYSLGYLLVQRQPGSVYLELQSPYARSDRIGDVFFMDSWIKVINTPASDTVTGLEHLEGYTCQVLADGAVHPDRAVVNGQITLQAPATEVEVGLGYDKAIKTMPFDKEIQGGSAMGHKKHWNKLYVRVLDSARPSINGQRPPTRSPQTPMNTREPNKSEDVEVWNVGYDNFAEVEVLQDLPLQLIIVGVFGSIKLNKP